MVKLIKVLDDGQGDSRLSGNGSFPAPKKSDIGREVVMGRKCLTWPGFLGWFADDKTEKKVAFYDCECK